MKKDPKDFRWISVWLTAEAHRELTITALDAKVTLAELSRAIFEEFLKGDKEEFLKSL